MEHNLEVALDNIIQLAKQTPEFNRELRKRLQVAPSANSSFISDPKIDSIYEHCIEQIIKQHAAEFYKDFPINEIVPTLVNDFIRMEEFRRKDRFGDFCLAAYQQIECITNHLCESLMLSEIFKNMCNEPAYIKIGRDITPDIANRGNTNYSIAKLVYKNRYQDKLNSSLKEQSARDKIRVIIYFIGYKAMMKPNDYSPFSEYSNLIFDIYQCRNLNHRGNTNNEYEQSIYDRILPMKSFYYFKFMGALAQFIEYIKDGYESLNTIYDYALTC